MRSMCQSEYHTSQKDTYSTHTLLVSTNPPQKETSLTHALLVTMHP